MTITVTPTVQAADGDHPNRVQIEIATDTDDPNPVAAGALVSLARTDPDGVSRPVIVEQSARLSAGAWTGYDYHAPFNADVRYTATFGDSSGQSDAVQVESSTSWLIHPTNPALSVKLDAVVSIADRPADTTAVTFWPVGAVFPKVVDEGVRHANSGTLVVRSWSTDNREALDSLFSAGGPVLFNLAGGGDWPDESWCWVQPGTTTWSNPLEYNGFPFRELTIPYQVIDTPAGFVTPLWSWQDVIDTYDTWQDVIDAYATWADVITDTRAS